MDFKKILILLVLIFLTLGVVSASDIDNITSDDSGIDNTSLINENITHSHQKQSVIKRVNADIVTLTIDPNYYTTGDDVVATITLNLSNGFNPYYLGSGDQIRYKVDDSKIYSWSGGQVLSSISSTTRTVTYNLKNIQGINDGNPHIVYFDIVKQYDIYDSIPARLYVNYPETPTKISFTPEYGIKGETEKVTIKVSNEKTSLVSTGTISFTLNGKEYTDINVVDGSATVNNVQLPSSDAKFLLTFKNAGYLVECDIILKLRNSGDPIGPDYGDDPIFVSPTGDDSVSINSRNAPYKTISKALEDASDDSESVIVLLPGTYFEHDLQIINSVKIYGEGLATIDANSQGKIFNITGTGVNVTLENLILKGAYSSTSGAAINFYSSGSATLNINNCTFKENKLTNGIIKGSAIFLHSGSFVHISNSIFANNTGGNGVVVALESSTSQASTITKSVFIDNPKSKNGVIGLANIIAYINSNIFEDESNSKGVFINVLTPSTGEYNLDYNYYGTNFPDFTGVDKLVSSGNSGDEIIDLEYVQFSNYLLKTMPETFNEGDEFKISFNYYETLAGEIGETVEYVKDGYAPTVPEKVTIIQNTIDGVARARYGQENTKYDSQVIVESVNFDRENNLIFKFKIAQKDDYNKYTKIGDVNVKLDEGGFSNIDIPSDGIITLNYPKLSAGVHNIEIVFEGNQELKPLNAIEKITAKKIANINVSPIAGQISTTVDVTITLETLEGETVTSGTIKFNGETKIVSNGKVEFSYKLPDTFGQSILTIEFIGGDEYNDGEVDANVFAYAGPREGVIYVSQSQGNDLYDGDITSPVKTLKDAINKAQTGEIVLLDGVFTDKNLTINSNLNILARDGVILSSPSDDTSNNLNVLTINGSYNVYIENITFTNPSTYSHAAIRNNGGNLEIYNCTFTNFRNNLYGIVDTRSGGNLIVTNSRFDYNPGTGGASIHFQDAGDLKVYNTSFIGNNRSAGWSYTSAIHIVNSGSAIIDNCIIADSTGYNSIGLYVSDKANVKVSNTSFINNKVYGFSDNENIIYLSGGGVNVNMEYCVFVNNTGGDYLIYSENGVISLDKNYWGSNSNPKSNVNSKIKINDWIVMDVSPKEENLNNIKAGDILEVTANFNKYTSDDVEFKDIPKGESIPDVLIVQFSSSTGKISQEFVNIVNGSASANYSVMEGENKVLVNDVLLTFNGEEKETIPVFIILNPIRSYEGDSINLKVELLDENGLKVSKGVLNLSFSTYNYSCNVSDGIGEFIINEPLSVGAYNLKFNYTDDSYTYTSSSNSTSLIVSVKPEVNYSISGSDITGDAGSTVNMDVSVRSSDSSSVSGSVRIVLEGETFTGSIVDGVGSIRITLPGSSGKYSASLTFIKDSVELASSTSQVTVNAKSPDTPVNPPVTPPTPSNPTYSIISEDVFGSPDEDAIVIVRILSSTGTVNSGNVTLTFNDESFTLPVFAGVSTIQIKLPTASTIGVITYTDGNLNLNTNINIFVNSTSNQTEENNTPINPVKDLDTSLTLAYDSEAKGFYGTLLDENSNFVSGEVYITVESLSTKTTKTYTANANGEYFYSIDLKAGDYSISAFYIGSENYKPSTVESHYLSLLDIPSNAILNDSDKIEGVYGENTRFTGVLSTNSGNVLAGFHVAVNITRLSSGASKVYWVTTDYAGNYIMPINLAPGVYTIKSIVNDSNYTASSISSLVITRENTTVDSNLTVIQAHNTVINYNHGESFKAKLLDKLGYGIAGQHLSLTLSNSRGQSKTYNVVSDYNGEFNLVINLAPGVYTINCFYNGTEIFKSSSSSNTITVI